ncbi:MAG: YihA family ribosome biogenesis GTP-binding protein [Christensenellaceae bacterium]|nr:YihA family ribosome biogenesis GTP-binding protein [Christensenellaceae bacterium]
MIIRNANFVTSMAEYGQFDGIGLKQVAVIGKSNVGKSTLINTLCNQNKLCKTSGTPGKTRLINVFNIDVIKDEEVGAFHLIDLPGYGYAKVSNAEKIRWGQMMDDYFHNSEELCLVLHLVDIRHDPTKDDIIMSNFLRSVGIDFKVVATKADKISKGARMKHIAPICRLLNVQPWEVTLTSSVNKDGKASLLKDIAEYIF